jgi:hypothetical protein
MPILRILILTVCLALAFGGTFPVEGKAADACDHCGALQQSDDCEGDDGSMACQPCLGGGCLGPSLLGGAGLAQAAVPAVGPRPADSRLASRASKPLHAPPRA